MPCNPLGLAKRSRLGHLAEPAGPARKGAPSSSADTEAPGAELHLLGFVMSSRLILAFQYHHHVHQPEAPTQVFGSLGVARTALFCTGLPTVRYGTTGHSPAWPSPEQTSLGS